VDPGVLRTFQEDPDVSFALVFGSQVTGRVGPLSDHDFAVYLRIEDPQARFRRGLRLAGLLGSILKTAAVDVVVLNDATPELAHQVLTTGRVLLRRDREEFINYQVQVSAAYLDREPMRRIYHAALMTRLREGKFGVRH
jgi:predicted nucleotidyltransferase